MISWTKLLTGESQDSDYLRYAVSRSGTPKVVVWNITARCNLRCKHCYIDAVPNTDSNDLSQREAQDFIEDVAGLGVPVLLFSGGEPLVRKDIFELGTFAQERGIRTVLSTNGTLITRETAKKIKKAGFSYVGISLDGMETTHDYFRQKKGAFSQALNGIRNCQNSGLKVGVRFTLTKYNYKDVPGIFDLIEKESIARFCLYHLVYTGRGSDLMGQDISHNERRVVLDCIWHKTVDFHRKGLPVEILTVDNHADGVWIYQRLKKNDPHHAQKVLKLLQAQEGNSSGIKIAAVDNCGNIYADQFWRSHVLGNIRTNKFSVVWQDNDNQFLKNVRNRKSLIEGRCQRCNFFDICNGNFRARAEAVSGNPWAEDPACFLTEEEIRA